MVESLEAEFLVVTINFVMNIAKRREVRQPTKLEEYVLSRLDEKFLQAVIAFDFEGLPYAESANKLKLPLNTFRTRLHRGRQAFKKEMKKITSNE